MTSIRKDAGEAQERPVRMAFESRPRQAPEHDLRAAGPAPALDHESGELREPPAEAGSRGHRGGLLGNPIVQQWTSGAAPEGEYSAEQGASPEAAEPEKATQHGAADAGQAPGAAQGEEGE